MRFHWLWQKTTWISIHLVSTVHLPLTVSEDDFNQHTLGWNWWDSTDCVSEDVLDINTSLFWTNLICLTVCLKTTFVNSKWDSIDSVLPVHVSLISSSLSLSAVSVCCTPITSCLCQHYLCVVLPSLSAFVSTACVLYSHHFLPLSALPVCGTLVTSCLSLSALPVCGSLITSCLCQHCLCVVLHHFLPLSALPVCGTPSLPAFVSTACVWYSHHFLPLSALPVCGTLITSCLSLSRLLRPTDQGDILVCSPTHALSMSVIVFIHKRF